MKILKAEVVNCPIANTKYGQKRVLNCKLLPSKEKVACWSNDINNPIYLSKKPGQVIELIEDDKGKYSVLDREPAPTSSSNGTSNTKEVASKASISDARGAVGDYLEDSLGLPMPLTDRQKLDLSRLAKERAKLLVHSIEVVRTELDRKGIEFHEGSIRSLGVSLFINISRYLP